MLIMVVSLVGDPGHGPAGPALEPPAPAAKLKEDAAAELRAPFQPL
jgi:hypothetical protein